MNEKNKIPRHNAKCFGRMVLSISIYGYDTDLLMFYRRSGLSTCMYWSACVGVCITVEAAVHGHDPIPPEKRIGTRRKLLHVVSHGGRNFH